MLADSLPCHSLDFWKPRANDRRYHGTGASRCDHRTASVSIRVVLWRLWRIVSRLSLVVQEWLPDRGSEWSRHSATDDWNVEPKRSITRWPTPTTTGLDNGFEWYHSMWSDYRARHFCSLISSSCTAFSIAGQRHGWNSSESSSLALTLWYCMFHGICMLVLENVANLKHDTMLHHFLKCVIEWAGLEIVHEQVAPISPLHPAERNRMLMLLWVTDDDDTEAPNQPGMERFQTEQSCQEIWFVSSFCQNPPRKTICIWHHMTNATKQTVS